MNIHVHHHYDNNLINLKIDKIMATIQELSTKVDELQTALDSEQEQVVAAIGKLEDRVAELQEIVQDGGTVEERQALADKLDVIVSDLKNTIPDA